MAQRCQTEAASEPSTLFCCWKTLDTALLCRLWLCTGWFNPGIGYKTGTKLSDSNSVSRWNYKRRVPWRKKKTWALPIPSEEL